MSGILLPKINSIKLIGFSPLISKTVDLYLSDGPFLILAGNAMGKTTTLQAIVYAIAGGAEEDMQENSGFRWGARFFSERFSPGQDSEVQIEFSLSETKFHIRRGFKTDVLLGLKIDEEEWVHDSEKAQFLYSTAILNLSGCSFSDFRFLMHRLCFLPETRQSLIWDQRAQRRIVMLVCSDSKMQSTYNDLAKDLRDLDTQKRHLNVDIGNLRSRLETLKKAKKTIRITAGEEEIAKKAVAQIAEIQKVITSISLKRLRLSSELKEVRNVLSDQNEAIEKIQEELSKSEDAFLFKTLKNVEEHSSALALQKLLVYHRCPYCSQESEKLATFASEAIATGNCPICGQNHSISETNENLDVLRKKAASLNQLRDASELKYREIQEQMDGLTEEERDHRAKLDEIGISLPRIPKEKGIEIDTKNAPAAVRTLNIYESRHAELEVSWQQTKEILDRIYKDFVSASSIRLERLLEIASAYGESFLGHKCSFVAIRAKGELGDFEYFVPEFEEIRRDSPVKCSESERFFLDIAFRMALIELSGELSESNSTFLCETPENALDLSYTRNVAKMFASFVRSGFSILLTANIQTGGVAEPLLSLYPPKNRRKRIFNLLYEGNRSPVQDEDMPNLEKQLAAILGPVE